MAEEPGDSKGAREEREGVERARVEKQDREFGNKHPGKIFTRVDDSSDSDGLDPKTIDSILTKKVAMAFFLKSVDYGNLLRKAGGRHLDNKITRWPKGGCLFVLMKSVSHNEDGYTWSSCEHVRKNGLEIEISKDPNVPDVLLERRVYIIENSGLYGMKIVHFARKKSDKGKKIKDKGKKDDGGSNLKQSKGFEDVPAETDS